MTLEPSPAAEVDVSEAQVRRLLEDQHPDLAHLPLRSLGSGWDNAIVRLGDDLVVRLPRRQAAVDLVVHEQRWLPELAPRLPLPIPVPLRTGRPGVGYPWPWSICRWMPGGNALDAPPTDPATASVLGGFLAALHQPSPPGLPVNPALRGGPLAACDPVVRDRIARLGVEVPGRDLLALWDRLVATPPWPGPPVWVHGDVHPGNLVVDRGSLVGVIDFGDITSGDPATDLAVAWTLLPPEQRPTLRAAAGRSDDADTWARARGWALHLGCAYLLSSADRPEYEALGRRALAEVLADDQRR